jgi:threonine/homoserine/homoserine lactone efflux protein
MCVRLIQCCKAFLLNWVTPRLCFIGPPTSAVSCDLVPQFFLLGVSAICVETAVLAGYAGVTILARGAVARPPFARRVVDAITGGFFIAMGLLLGTKNADA